jgi:hypothetical protein
MKRSEYERTLTAQVCGKELYLEQTVTLIESTFANRNGETKKLKQCRIVFLDSHRAARTRRHDILRGRRLADSRSQNVQRRQFNQRVGVALPTLAHSSGDAPVFMQTICIHIFIVRPSYCFSSSLCLVQTVSGSRKETLQKRKAQRPPFGDPDIPRPTP